VTESSDILDSSDVLSTFDDTPIYSNKSVVDLVTQAQGTLDASKRITYLQQANKAMADDIAAVPLFTQADNNSIVYDPSYVVQRDIENNNLGVYFYKVYAK
jgi:ABC-type transport system substrate-binding protein